MMRNSFEMFYARWESKRFDTAKTLSGHSLAPKPAAQDECGEHSWETMKAATPAGAIPANVSESDRAMVTAG
jgi:hypothetical protein